MIDIPNQDDALFIENGAALQNTFYYNVLLDSANRTSSKKR